MQETLKERYKDILNNPSLSARRGLHKAEEIPAILFYEDNIATIIQEGFAIHKKYLDSKTL